MLTFFSLFTSDAAMLKLKLTINYSLNEFSIPNFFFGLLANKVDSLCFRVYSQNFVNHRGQY